MSRGPRMGCARRIAAAAAAIALALAVVRTNYMYLAGDSRLRLARFQSELNASVELGWGGGIRIVDAHPGRYNGCHMGGGGGGGGEVTWVYLAGHALSFANNTR
eukprot:SAG22_NODE_14376_length_376_cov_0.736462_1_plen_103_part_01